MTISQDVSQRRWRTVDIVLAAVLAVAFGAVFQAWNLLWVALLPAFVAVPPLQGFMYGVWLLPAVLVPLIIRRPGAALLGEGVAAVASLTGVEPGAVSKSIRQLIQVSME